MSFSETDRQPAVKTAPLVICSRGRNRVYWTDTNDRHSNTHTPPTDCSTWTTIVDDSELVRHKYNELRHTRFHSPCHRPTSSFQKVRWSSCTAWDLRLDGREFDSWPLPLILGWVTVLGRANHLGVSLNHLDQLSLLPYAGREMSTG